MKSFLITAHDVLVVDVESFWLSRIFRESGTLSLSIFSDFPYKLRRALAETLQSLALSRGEQLLSLLVGK
jgi:hypothetical protein